MRDRLIAAFVGLAIAVVALYGVPRAFVLADQVHASEHRKIERSIELLAVIVAERPPERPVTGEFLNGLLHEAERIEYTDSKCTLSQWKSGRKKVCGWHSGPTIGRFGCRCLGRLCGDQCW